MDNYDRMLLRMKAAQYQKEKDNLRYFLQGFSSKMVPDLDRMYAENDPNYMPTVNRTKSLGFRVLRNSDGHHKIEI